MPDKRLEQCADLWLRAVRNPLIPHLPTERQAVFLILPQREAFYGGAAGGGKTDALLMAALQYVDTPGYSALLLRRTYAELEKPESLMDRANTWLYGKAHWIDRKKQWEFPSGATLSFGYLQIPNDILQYQSAAYQFIGFDEVTEHREKDYRFLFSRLRRLRGVKIPLRMRSASNPNGPGHEWVKKRFITEGAANHRPFVKALLEDNPHLDREEYEKSLENLDPVVRKQLRDGDWDVRSEGKRFKREWFQIVEDAPAGMPIIRFWDLAATEPKKGKDPDFVAGVKFGLKNGVYYVLDVARTRTTPHGVEKLIQQTALMDGKQVFIYIEMEGGASGKMTIDRFQREVLLGYACNSSKPTVSKEVRAYPVSSAAEAGNIKLLNRPWLEEFLWELEAFPTEGWHDDQVDALSGAFDTLNLLYGVTAGKGIYT